MHVRGHFKNISSTDPGCPSDGQCVFMATCSPLITPDIKETLVQNNTMVFKTVHKLDMTFLGLSKNGEYHLGYTAIDLNQRSWYSLLHPEDILEAKEKHTQLIRSNHEASCMLTVRMLKYDGTSFWVNIVMQMQQACLSQNNEPLIVCINQVIDAHEAYQIKIQGHMFSMYPNCAHDLWGSHLTATCSPVQSNIGCQWISQNALPVSEHQVNIPSYIEHIGSPEVPLNTYPSNTSSNSKPFSDCALQGSFKQQDDLKALLKRKIQGPQSKSCKPSKLPRVSWDSGNFNGLTGCTDMGQGLSQDQQYTMTSVPSYVDCQNQVMQVQQPYNHTSGFMTVNKMSLKQVTCQGVSKMNNMISEQIVPESFLTPDPSPVSSPQPSHLSVKTEVLDHEEKDTQGQSVNILQALEKLVAHPHMNSNEKVPVVEKEKELPILDVFYIQTYFDELTGELEFKTSFRMEDKMKCEIKKELLKEQKSPVNIPNFAALKDERSSSSPCIPCNNSNDNHSNIHPSSHPQIQPQMKLSSQSHVQSKTKHSSQSQLLAKTSQNHCQLPKISSSLPQIQSESYISSQTHVQPQQKPYIEAEIKSLFQPHVLFQAAPSQTHVKAHMQPSLLTQVQTYTPINYSTQIKPSVPHSYNPAIQNSACMSLDYPYVDDSNILEPHSSVSDYHKDILMSSTVVSSPESVTSQETIDELMSYLSDDGLDKLRLQRRSSTIEDGQNSHSEKSVCSDITDCTKLPNIDTHHMSELLSPELSTSSLDDDLYDNPEFALEMALKDIITTDQILFTSNCGMKDQNDLGMPGNLKQDLMLDSWVSPQGTHDLKMIKHSQ